MQKKNEKQITASPFTAVICELNPPHLGHQYLFDCVKKQGHGLVCILSGNFVQRGDVAILDKWARTEIALQMGADLVIELPLPWACAGAERFAAGGVSLAAALPGVSSLAFGCETTDQTVLLLLAEVLLSPAFMWQLAATPDKGEPFAVRRECAIAALCGEQTAALLRAPNAILGVEYCKAILAQQATLNPLVVQRIGAAHDSNTGSGAFRSASELRGCLLSGGSIAEFVPDCTQKTLQKELSAGRAPAQLERVEQAILWKLRSKTTAELASLPDLSEGLEHRFAAAIQKACSLQQLYELTKTKRYSHARIRRLVLSAALNIQRDLPNLPPYLHVLGMSTRGAQLLKSARLPVLTRASQYAALPQPAQDCFLLEAHADDLYALATPATQPCGRTFTEHLRRTTS